MKDNSDSTILLVEDSFLDVAIIRAALKKAEIVTDLIHIGNGDEALEYLKGKRTRPTFIILDINLPGKNGYDILRFIRTTAEYQNIKVVVFTGEENQDEKKLAKWPPDMLLRKPRSYEEYQIIVNMLCQEWLK